LIPSDRHYTADHLWVSAEGSTVRLGVTAFAQEALGEIIIVDLPQVGASVEVGEPFASIETSKAVIDVCSPIDGQVSAVNSTLEGEPATINRDPYGAGWICLVATDRVDVLEGMLDATGYRDLVGLGG
jgi:glycine cleavage system H protein